MKIEQLLQCSVNSNSVQSTITNNKSIQQTVIDLVPNPRITLFPYSNIQENLTINLYGTNDKNWNSDLYWNVMFNSCNMVNYHIFWCNMFVFACPIIAKSQCWLFQGKYGAIRICPHISVFAPEFNFRYLCSGLKVQGKMMHKDMHKFVFQSN